MLAFFDIADVKRSVDFQRLEGAILSVIVNHALKRQRLAYTGFTRICRLIEKFNFQIPTNINLADFLVEFERGTPH
jgi:hypothetical protein